jgi:hypothetical protein
MKKTVMLSVRLTPLEKQAFQEACDAERSTPSQMAGKLVVDWLRGRGFLKREETHA